MSRPASSSGTLGAILATVSLCLSAAGVAGMAMGDDEAAVRDVFDAYKAALLEGDGDAAVALVDSATISYFAELRELALDGTREAVQERSFIERLLIVSIRHELPREEVAELGLADLIRLAVEKGWIQRQSVEQLEMGEVTIEGDRAWGEARTRAASASSGGNPLESLRYEFVAEGGAWRFRFGSLVESLDKVIADLALQLGLQEDDLIFTLVESISGRQVLPDVWERPE